MIQKKRLLFAFALLPILIASCSPSLTPEPTMKPHAARLPTVSVTPDQTHTPTNKAQPTSTPQPTTTYTPTVVEPSSTATSATSAGGITASNWICDAGSCALTAGEMTTLTWQDAPLGASLYEFLFDFYDGSPSQSLGVDEDASDGVEIEWMVSENLAGVFEALATFADGRVIHAGWSLEIYSGSAPPSGICSLSSASIGVVDVYTERDFYSVSFGYITPGTYVQIFEITGDGWYLVDASDVVYLVDQEGAHSTGWVHENQPIRLHGACDDIP